MSPLVQPACDKVAPLRLLHRLAESKHRGHQVQQRPAEIMVGDQDIPVTQPQMVDGVAGNWPVRYRHSQGACDELLPASGVAMASGVYDPAPHGAVFVDLGHFDPHERWLPCAAARRRLAGRPGHLVIDTDAECPR